MKVLAVLQLILAVYQVWWYWTHRRAVKVAIRTIRSQPAPFKLDGCTCPPVEDGSYRAYHYRECPWSM